MFIHSMMNFIGGEVRPYFSITFCWMVVHRLSLANFTESFTIKLGFFNRLC